MWLWGRRPPHQSSSTETGCKLHWTQETFARHDLTSSIHEKRLEESHQVQCRFCSCPPNRKSSDSTVLILCLKIHQVRQHWHSCQGMRPANRHYSKHVKSCLMTSQVDWWRFEKCDEIEAQRQLAKRMFQVNNLTYDEGIAHDETIWAAFKSADEGEKYFNKYIFCQMRKKRDSCFGLKRTLGCSCWLLLTIYIVKKNKKTVQLCECQSVSVTLSELFFKIFKKWIAVRIAKLHKCVLTNALLIRGHPPFSENAITLN